MTDEQVRALERRFRETGALEDEVAWLAARLRAGELSDERLRLAAWVGHPAATRVSGAAPGLEAALEAGWLGELADFGPEACVRAGLAAARLAVPAWEAGVLGVVARAPRRVLEAGEAWLACPCPKHLAAATVAAVDVGIELEEFVLDVADERIWRPLAPERCEAAAREYEREVAPQAAGPERPKSIQFFASGEADDRCGLVLDAAGRPTGDVASVHLTWSVEHDPRRPTTRLSDLAGWVRNAATYWPPDMPIGAAQAALWAVSPATLTACPAFNASAPAAHARLRASRERVAAALRDALAAWALRPAA